METLRVVIIVFNLLVSTWNIGVSIFLHTEHKKQIKKQSELKLKEKALKNSIVPGSFDVVFKEVEKPSTRGLMQEWVALASILQEPTNPNTGFEEETSEGTGDSVMKLNVTYSVNYHNVVPFRKIVKDKKDETF